MKKYSSSWFQTLSNLSCVYIRGKSFIITFILVLGTGMLFAQTKVQVTGKVVDEKNEPIKGASITQEGSSISTATRDGGVFSLFVTDTNADIIVTAVGYNSKSVSLKNGFTGLSIQLEIVPQSMDNIVVVGYGRQKKESLVGAITQTTGKVLERTGGVTNLGMALTGNLPGVVTTSSSGMPGAEDPQILIRAQTTWNNAQPLILVDMVERSISSIDIASVESISVLKDASATAVFGVRGANGVILITTKKGVEGKASINLRANTTVKTASRLPGKYDSYDALSLKNRVIENEILVNPGAWAGIKPEEILLKYRYPANDAEWDRYPNVDWQKELFRDIAMSYGANANVSGGTKFVTYFASVDFVSEGDLFKTFQNNRGYKSGYGYNRVNVRSNLDFNLTKTTKFSTKLFGSKGERLLPWGAGTGDGAYFTAAYRSSPDAMRPVYSDGTWGWYSPRNADVPNSIYDIAVSGLQKRTTTQLTSDFIITQELDMITKGLSARANYSLDNTFLERDRGVNDNFNGPQRKWIDPENGNIVLEYAPDAGTQLDYTDMVRWTNQPGSVDRGATLRRINYSAQLNYSRRFDKHDITGMGLFLRQKSATGGSYPTFREDWVFRATYGYDSRYLLDINGAYNGSEQFGPNHRFAFFPSAAAGWVISNEKFMQAVNFISNLKIRGSWGRVGHDNLGTRWLYIDQWGYGGNAQMGSPLQNTPYTYFRMNSLGNPNISWETVEKRNVGIEADIFKGLFSFNVDFFSDHRTNILIGGGSRAIPTYFGVAAPPANLGEVKGRGYEAELKFNKRFANGIRLWANTNMTRALNEVIFRDDPDLLPAYQKQAGWQLGQTRSYINSGFITTWDDIYGSTTRTSGDRLKLPGDYNIIDFNGDGVIDRFDSAPFQYSGSPQNTYNASLGIDYKGLSLFLQFYGVNNVTRYVDFPTFNTYSGSNTAFIEGSYWVKESGGGAIPLPRQSTVAPEGGNGTRYLYDGSYVRLKNAEISYTLSGNAINFIGVRSCRFYLNGNNLFLWTKMPDDRESNFATGGSGSGAYPTVRRFNLGIDINL